jgi:hypothetical protein
LQVIQFALNWGFNSDRSSKLLPASNNCKLGVAGIWVEVQDWSSEQPGSGEFHSSS